MLTIVYELSEHNIDCYKSINESFEKQNKLNEYPFNVIVFDYDNFDEFIFDIFLSKFKSHIKYFNEKNKTKISLKKLLVEKVPKINYISEDPFDDIENEMKKTNRLTYPQKD